MTVTRKVLVVLLTSLLAMVLLVVLGAITLMWVADRKDDVVEYDSRVVMDAHRLNASVAERAVAVRNYLLVGDERYLAEIEEADEHYGDALAGLRLRAHTDETRRLLGSIEQQVARVNRENEDLIGDRREGRVTAAAAGEVLEARVRPIRQELTSSVDQLVAVEEGMIAEALRSSDAAAVNGRRLLVGLGALVTVATLVVGIRLTRSLSRSLTGMALTIEAASAEIVAGTAQQVSGATQQAASVQQTVATTDELAQTAEQSARWARTVADRAKESAEEVRGGSEAVQDSMAVMEEIRSQVDEIAATVVALAERAQDISGIVATVDEIADQVHLLGLNAAIEAARAGEHGRGFAVVAGEVRALADQSRRATVQISDILGEIQQRTNRAVIATEDGGRSVTKGVERMRATGETIDRMAEASAAAAIAAEQISASSAQQAVATAQISQAMRDLDSVTQQSAAAARQVEDSAAGLNSVAVDLKSLVGAE